MTTFALPAELTIEECPALRESLLALAGGDEIVAIDAGAVTRLSTPALQMLLSLGKSAATSGATLRLQPQSPVVAAALATLGCPSFCEKETRC